MSTQLIMILVGILVIFLGATGISGKTRKNRWLVRTLGETGFKILNVILGIVFIVIALVFY